MTLFATRRIREYAAVLASAATAMLLACASTQAGISDQILHEGHAHDVKLEAKEALACYLQIEKEQPTNADVLVRIARQYRHLMADASSNSEKLKLGTMALGYGNRAAALAPRNSDAQLSCAISYAKMLPLMSKKEQVSSSRLIKDGAERAIKLDKTNDLAWHVLGRWHQNVANMSSMTRALAAMIYDKLPAASNEESAACLERALMINPHRLMHFIELGKTYAQMGRTDDARRYIKKGLSMPCEDKDDPAKKAVGLEVLASLN